MSIVRAPRPDAGYLVIRNEVLRDERLTLKALGLLVRILSRPDNWETSAEKLQAECVEGRDAIGSALRQLREVGYMRQERLQDPATGQWSTTTYVYDEPNAAEPTTGNPLSGVTRGDVDPTTGNQGSGNQPSDSQGVSRNTEKKDQETVTRKRATKTATTRGTRITTDWKPSDPVKADMKAELVGWVDADFWREHRIFIDFWLGAVKGVKLDWDATWRNWMRRAYKDAGGNVHGINPRAGARGPQPAPRVQHTESAAPDPDTLPWANQAGR